MQFESAIMKYKVLIFLSFSPLIFNLVECNRGTPETIEGTGTRRSGRKGDHEKNNNFASIPLEKEKVDMEIVKQNLEAYNKLMSVDTKKLSSHQKDMLERIVERVARFKAVLDENLVDHSNNSDRESKESVESKQALHPTPFVASVVPNTTVHYDQTEVKANGSSTDSNINKSDTESRPRMNQSTIKPTQASSPTTKRHSGQRIPTKHAASESLPKNSNVTSLVNNARPILSGQDFKHSLYTNSIENKIAVNQRPINYIDATKDTGEAVNKVDESVLDKIYNSNETASSLIDSLGSHAREDYYTKGGLIDNSEVKKPTAAAKPTKYHYYPHNQHIYLLPECAIQQVCNAVYVRLNYTQPLCACPSRYRDPCSASLNEDDQHTTKLIGNSKKKAITLAKTCETVTEMRECRSPKDWSLLALQNTRTGKSHYLVICRCPDHFQLEGPMAHDQPTYASVPGIRVFGMMCVRPGFSIRKPSIQPPKRYNLQKPLYMTTSQYLSDKDTKPSYQDANYQSDHQANYHYLHRPETSSVINVSNAQDFVDNISSLGIYGRNNIRKETDKTSSEDTTQTNREKRSHTEDNPPFPWNRAEQFRNSIIWD